MRKLKILLLNFEYPPLGGGASPVAMNIALELLKRGHQITVVTMGWENLPYYSVEDGIEIFRINSGRKAKNISHPKEHLRFIRNARNFLKAHLLTHKYDVCHCHFILSTGLLAKWVYQKFNLPYIITAHGSDLPGFNPDRFQFIHWITPFFIRRILKTCSIVVSPSEYLSKLIQAFLNNRSTEMRIIPNGISPEFISREKKQKIILSTGRLLHRKGFQTLIRAVKDIESDFEVHICGDGPMREELEKLALNSRTKIIFHGWLENSSSKYRKLLAEASIYCLMSSFENASISLLEAMSAGCAVITSNVTGCPETVGASGICIPPKEVQSLKNKLQELIQNPELASKLGKAAQNRIKREFLWPNIADKYESALLETADYNR